MFVPSQDYLRGKAKRTSSRIEKPALEPALGGKGVFCEHVDVSQMFPGPNERVPKLTKRLPSIVVEPMDSSEVESGELRWPPVETRSPETQEPGHTVPPSAPSPPGQTTGERG